NWLSAVGQWNINRGLEHFHKNTGRNAVARDVGYVTDPAFWIFGKVDEVASNLSARDRRAEYLEAFHSSFECGHERAVDLACQFDLRLNPEVAIPLSSNESHEEDVRCNDRDNGPESEHRVLFLKNVSV